MKKPITIIAVFALLGAGLFALYQPRSSCVNLHVDFGSLDSGATVSKCIPVTDEINALDLLATAKLSFEGTQEYGNAVLCRLNGLPDSTVESCAEMPPAEAYWAVFVKEYEAFPVPFNTQGEWGWAQTGINEVHLHPGESLGLVFIEDGKVRYP